MCVVLSAAGAEQQSSHQGEQVEQQEPQSDGQTWRAGARVNGVTPGGVDGRELVWEGAFVTEVGAGGADQDAVVDPVVDSHADTQQLTFTDAEEGAILNEHSQALSRAPHLVAAGAPVRVCHLPGALLHDEG